MKSIVSIFWVLIMGMMNAQSPGGVGGVSVWYKTNSGHSPALTYPDYSGNKHQIQALASANKPSYSLLNYNECLEFDGADDYLKFPYVIETADKINFFTAYQNKNAHSESALFTTEATDEKELFYGTKNIFRYNNEQINYISTHVIDTLASFSLYSKFGMPSGRITEVIGNTGLSSLLIGKDSGTHQWQNFKGKLPEFFIYKKMLTLNERNRVNSYLAIKYAVTMPYTEYISSKNKTIWRHEDFSEYPSNIAGIGRDDYSALYQKQATSSSEQKRLIIAAKKLAVDNKSNDAQLPEHTFLVWGDNKKPLELDQETFGYRLLKRKWKTRLTTESAHTVSTEVVFSVKDLSITIPSDKKLWLLIDRTGKGDFSASHIDAYPMEGIDNHENVYFKDIVFDKDLSGTDVFSFAVGDPILSLYDIRQPSCVNTKGMLQLNIKGGKAPFTVHLTGSGANQNFTAQTSQISFPNLAIGNYHLQILDSQNHTSNYDFNINDFNTISLDLGEDVILSSGNSAHFNAGTHITDPKATYKWTSDNGFVSSSSKISVDQPGEYTVVVTTSDGCVKKDSVRVMRKKEKGIVIYPNPVSKEDPFTIRIISDKKENIDIKIHDGSGRLVKTIQDKGNDHYEIKETLSVEGVYLIIVKTTSEIKVFKLIVKG
ncbi:T9SS type A sorting domain-containing protein [Chryseobacterium sp. MYb264]|uniref:T9SS type A sorting domain-containing protein n=1 Tax=Chryseobacterium sp. MYb264 TaxID=2745153 RepID=UPI002E13BD9A|nr:T9SS type A sorting domain-containing protein [Chryseobacterium sp. MYb264]